MTRVLHPWSSVCYPVPAPMAILIRSWSNSDHKQGWWWKCVEDFKLFSEARLSWTTIERLTRIAATSSLFSGHSVVLSFFLQLPRERAKRCGVFRSLRGVCPALASAGLFCEDPLHNNSHEVVRTSICTGLFGSLLLLPLLFAPAEERLPQTLWMSERTRRQAGLEGNGRT